MQFHLNGFRTGDPAVQPPHDATSSSADEIDVLIVGSGPTGLTLAAQLAAFPDIRTRIVERKPARLERLERGQADGIACRTLEMFEAFGLAERVLKESCWVNETAFWKPDPADRDVIRRTLEAILADPGFEQVWVTTPGRIADHALGLPDGVLP